MKTLKRALALLLAAVTLCGIIATPVFAASTQAFDILSSSKYAKTYTLSSSGKTIPYTNSKLSTRGTVTYGASSSAYIDNKSDELYIFDVGCTNGTYWAYVSYPTSNKRVNAYIPLSVLTKNNGSHAKTVSTGKFYCSLRDNTSTSSSYYVAHGDTVYLVATSGSKYQILYPISNGKYRLAWCNASDYKKYCGSSATNTTSKTTSIIGGQSDTPKDGAFVRIRYAANGRYLDVPAEGATKNGTQLQIWDSATSNTNQYFQLIDTGKGWQLLSLQGSNKKMTIQYGSSIEANLSGKKMSLSTLLVQRYYNFSPTIVFSSNTKADECIRNWFGITGSGQYSMDMSFGRVPLGEYGYYLLIENGTVYQVPIINANSSYKVYRKINGKTTYIFDAAQILRNAKLQLDDNAAAVVMRQLVKNGYIK